MLYWILVIMLAVLLISDVYNAIREYRVEKRLEKLLLRFLLLSALLYIIVSYIKNLIEITFG